MSSFDLIGSYQFMDYGLLAETIEPMQLFERGQNVNIHQYNVPTNINGPLVEFTGKGQALVNISGSITEKRQPSMDALAIRYTPVDVLTRELCDIIIRCKDIQEIVYLIDSCGGSPKACQEFAYLTQQLSLLKPIKTLVIGSMLSGAMLIGTAAGAGNVFALVPFCRFGSVGVISRYKERTSTDDPGYVIREKRAGKFKCADSNNEKTPDIENYLDEHILYFYDRFCKDIASFRNMPVDKIHEIADGQIFPAQTAIDLGLCDGFINLALWHLDKEIVTVSKKDNGGF